MSLLNHLNAPALAREIEKIGRQEIQVKSLTKREDRT